MTADSSPQNALRVELDREDAAADEAVRSLQLRDRPAVDAVEPVGLGADPEVVRRRIEDQGGDRTSNGTLEEEAPAVKPDDVTRRRSDVQVRGLSAPNRVGDGAVNRGYSNSLEARWCPGGERPRDGARAPNMAEDRLVETTRYLELKLREMQDENKTRLDEFRELLEALSRLRPKP